jgi:beta-xylosidase
MANNLRQITPRLFVLFFTYLSSASYLFSLSYSQCWPPDNGDGTYTNPVLFADYSDPDVILVGNDFYLTASSFNCIPGLPILRSKDLVNWKIVGHAIPDRLPAIVYDKPQHGKGVWAPSIRYHDSWYFIYYGDPDFGIYLVKAKNPEGPWTKPLLVKPALGWIDPCPLWDDDGNAYLIHAWAKSRAGFNSILTMHRMNSDGTEVLDEGVTVFDGHESHPTIEGPKIYKRADYYYVFAPAGGVKNGWQTVLRSKNIYGPYEDKIVLAQGNTEINGPHQGAWVQDTSGNAWFLHFQDQDAFGRIVHLQPMTWKDGWPLIGTDKNGDGIGYPVSRYNKPYYSRSFPVTAPQASDEFNGENIGPQWQWHANPDTNWGGLTTSDGNLVLKAIALPQDFRNFWDVPNLLLQKFCGPEFCATAQLSLNLAGDGERAGLIIMGADYSYLAVKAMRGNLSVMQTRCYGADKGAIEQEESSVPLANKNIYLRVTVTGNEVCNFSYSIDGDKFQSFGAPFKAKSGKWIGAKVGLFCVRDDYSEKSGYVKCDYFRVEKIH